MNIKCPKCDKTLKEINVSEIIFDKCDNCDGLWFDDKELFEAINKYKLNENDIKSDNSNSIDHSSTNNCPKMFETIENNRFISNYRTGNGYLFRM